MTGHLRRGLALALAALVLAAPAGAQYYGRQKDASASDYQTADQLPTALTEVSLEQRIGDSLPRELVFRDEQGRELELGELLGKRPVVLALVYYECPMLCTLVLNGLINGLKPLELEPGRDFDVIAVSFDPREGPQLAADKKRTHLASYGRPQSESGWHFLTGSPESIAALTEAVGFSYRFDPQTGQFAHPSGVMVATADGRLARYFYGVEYLPRDLRLALVEAGDGRLGGLVDQVLLYCFHYDPDTGSYGAMTMRLLRLAGIGTLVALGGFIGLAMRRERKRRRQPQGVR